MKTVTSRCTNCGDHYSLYLSGSHIPHNNSKDYCPSCKDIYDEAYKTVREALSKVPKEREEVWVETTEVTFQELKQYRKDQEELEDRQAVAEGIPMLLPRARRVFASLYNQESGKSSCSDLFVCNGASYSTIHWQDEDNVIIKKKMERIVKTGQIIKWEKLYKS